MIQIVFMDIDGTLIPYGQQEVNIGRSFNSPLVNLETNSWPSSIMVRSAENVVSKA